MSWAPSPFSLITHCLLSPIHASSKKACQSRGSKAARGTDDYYCARVSRRRKSIKKCKVNLNRNFRTNLTKPMDSDVDKFVATSGAEEASGDGEHGWRRRSDRLSGNPRTIHVNTVRCAAAMPCLTTMETVVRRALACSADIGRLYMISFKMGSTACFSGSLAPRPASTRRRFPHTGRQTTTRPVPSLSKATSTSGSPIMVTWPVHRQPVWQSGACP